VSTLTIDINDTSQINAAIASAVNDVVMQLTTMDLTANMRDLVSDLELQHSAMFTAERDENGTPWEPLSPWTVDQKGHDIRLFEFGELRDSLAHTTGLSVRNVRKESDGYTLEFGTHHRHSYVNHFGGPSSWGHTIPPRPHVGISEDTTNKFMNKLADDMVKRLQRGPSKVITP